MSLLLDVCWVTQAAVSTVLLHSQGDPGLADLADRNHGRKVDDDEDDTHTHEKSGTLARHQDPHLFRHRSSRVELLTGRVVKLLT